MQRLKKLKIDKNGKITICFEKENARGELDEFSLSSLDPPRPELKERLQELIPPILDDLDLPATYRHLMHVSGLILSYTDDIMGAVITLQKYLDTANSPLVISTPHKPEAPYGSGDTPVLLPSIVKGIEAVQKEAFLYVEGKRAQDDLFGSQEKAA